MRAGPDGESRSVVLPLGGGSRRVDVDRLMASGVGRIRYCDAVVCGARRTSRVISLGAKTRNGGPQKPVPRLV